MDYDTDWWEFLGCCVVGLVALAFVAVVGLGVWYADSITPKPKPLPIQIERTPLPDNCYYVDDSSFVKNVVIHHRYIDCEVRK